MDNVVVLVDEDGSILDPEALTATKLAAMASTFNPAMAARFPSATDSKLSVDLRRKKGEHPT